MIASIGPKNLLGFLAHVISIDDNMKPRFHIGEKGQGSLEVASVPKQRHRFTDDVPGRTECRADKGRLRHKSARSYVVGNLLDLDRRRKMTCRKYLLGNRHQRIAPRGP